MKLKDFKNTKKWLKDSRSPAIFPLMERCSTGGFSLLRKLPFLKVVGVNFFGINSNHSNCHAVSVSKYESKIIETLPA